MKSEVQIHTDVRSMCFVKSRAVSPLTFPEHHIRVCRETHSSDARPAQTTLPFLILDIIRRDNMGKKSLDFINRKESSGTGGS